MFDDNPHYFRTFKTFLNACNDHLTHAEPTSRLLALAFEGLANPLQDAEHRAFRTA